MTDTISIEPTTPGGLDPGIDIIDIRPAAASNGRSRRCEPRGERTHEALSWEELSVPDGGWSEWSRAHGASV